MYWEIVSSSLDFHATYIEFNIPYKIVVHLRVLTYFIIVPVKLFSLIILEIIHTLWFDLVYGVNATFNNISVISRQSVLLVEETGVSG